MMEEEGIITNYILYIGNDEVREIHCETYEEALEVAAEINCKKLYSDAYYIIRKW